LIRRRYPSPTSFSRDQKASGRRHHCQDDYWKSKRSVLNAATHFLYVNKRIKLCSAAAVGISDFPIACASYDHQHERRHRGASRGRPRPAAANHGQPRPDMAVDESKYVLSIDDAIARYKAAGIPRIRRTVQRYCSNGTLDAHRFAIPYGEKCLITPESLDRHIQYVLEARSATASIEWVARVPAGTLETGCPFCCSLC
jgi:hypothetical protein